jgi:hypothetical protein
MDMRMRPGSTELLRERFYCRWSFRVALSLLVGRSLNQSRNKSFAWRAVALLNKFIRHDAARQHVVPHPIEQHVFDFTERKHDEWPVAEIHAKDGHLYVGKLMCTNRETELQSRNQ